MAELQTEKSKMQRLKQEIDILKEDSMICKHDVEDFNKKTESLMNEIDSYKQKYEGLMKCLTNQTIESFVWISLPTLNTIKWLNSVRTFEFLNNTYGIDYLFYGYRNYFEIFQLQ